MMTEHSHSTSPSIFVAFPSIVGSDGCGQVGSAITSLTLAFAPGELSTVTNANPGPVPGTTIIFNPADMPCGPNNGTNDFLPDWTNVSSYQPLIALPSKLFALRTDWKHCTNDYWQGQDPPYALTPVAGPIAPFLAPAVHIISRSGARLVFRAILLGGCTADMHYWVRMLPHGGRPRGGSKTRTDADSPPTLIKPSVRNVSASNLFLKKTTMEPYALRAYRGLSQVILATCVLLLSSKAATMSFTVFFFI